MRIARGISIVNTSKPISTAAAFDADAVAFFTAANITDTTQKSAVNTLVLSLKSANIWSKMKAIYPVVGGVASSHAVNLKTPGTYNLSFGTGWTHSSTGITPNGATYATTSLIPSTALTLNSTHISYYSRSIMESGVDMGCQINGASLYLYCRDIGGYTYARVNTWGSGTDTAVINTNGTGLYVSNRNSSTIQSSIKNNTITNTNINSVSRPNVSIFIGALNNPIIYYGAKQCAFSSIGDGLTDAEALSFYNAVQAYQTTLGRQV